MMSSEPTGDREYEYPGRFHATMDFELMNSYRLSGVLCDVAIMVKGIEFPAHKLVLAVNSPYFRATFASDFESHAVHTLECDPSAFGSILNTLYTGIMMEITPDTVQDILQVASMLNISSAMERCCQVLELNMDVDNCIDLASLAKTNGCTKMAVKAELFAGLHFNEVVKSKDFPNYPAEKLAFLLSLDTLHIPEDSVFQAIMDWTKHDVTSRSVLLTKLLPHVRVPYISQDFLLVTAIPFLRENNNCQDYLRKLNEYLELSEEAKLSNSLHGVKPRDFESEVIVGLTFENNGLGFHVLDSEDGQWTRTTSIQNLHAAYGFVYEMNGKVYFLKLINNHDIIIHNLRGQIREFDLLTKTERLVATLGTARFCPSIVGLNGKIYIIGGKDDNLSPVSSVEVCSPEDNSCNYVAGMSSERLGSGVVAHEGRIYVFGGVNAGSKLSSAEVYIPEEDRWEDIPSMPVGRGLTEPQNVEGRIYVIGVYKDPDSKRIDCYDPERKIWTRVADLHYNFKEKTAVNWKGVLYVFHCQVEEGEGEEENKKHHNYLEKYDLKANLWIPMPSPFNLSKYIVSMFAIKKKYLHKQLLSL